jgi:hypothetical protein
MFVSKLSKMVLKLDILLKATISCEQMSSRPMSTKDFAALTGQAGYCPNNDFLPDLRPCEAERCSSGDVVHSITVL